MNEMNELERQYIEERQKLIKEGYDAYNATREAYKKIFDSEVQRDR